MARKKSEFLSAFAKALEIWKAIIDAILEEGGTDDDARRVVTQKGLAKQIAQLIMASAVKPATQAVAQVATTVAQEVVTAFKAVVEYIQPCYEDLKRGFDWVNSDFRSARFEPIERCKGVLREAREITFHYVHLGRDASTEAVLAEMDRLGLRPALYEELLAFAKQYPDEQRKFPVVALGSVWVDPRGHRRVAYLCSGVCERRLSLGWIGFVWDGDCRFLAVSK